MEPEPAPPKSHLAHIVGAIGVLLMGTVRVLDDCGRAGLSMGRNADDVARFGGSADDVARFGSSVDGLPVGARLAHGADPMSAGRWGLADDVPHASTSEANDILETVAEGSVDIALEVLDVPLDDADVLQPRQLGSLLRRHRAVVVERAGPGAGPQLTGGQGAQPLVAGIGRSGFGRDALERQLHLQGEIPRLGLLRRRLDAHPGADEARPRRLGELGGAHRRCRQRGKVLARLHLHPHHPHRQRGALRRCLPLAAAAEPDQHHKQPAAARNAGGPGGNQLKSVAG